MIYAISVFLQVTLKATYGIYSIKKSHFRSVNPSDILSRILILILSLTNSIIISLKCLIQMPDEIILKIFAISVFLPDTLKAIPDD